MVAIGIIRYLSNVLLFEYVWVIFFSPVVRLTGYEKCPTLAVDKHIALADFRIRKLVISLTLQRNSDYTLTLRVGFSHFMECGYTSTS